MTPWTDFVRDCAKRHGVGSTRLAEAAGVARVTFLRRAKLEGWRAPYPSVRILPGTDPDVRTEILAFCAATTVLAAASGPTSLWLHGLRPWPPPTQHVAVAQSLNLRPVGGVRAHKTRWIRPDDLTTIDAVPALTVASTLAGLAAWPRAQLLPIILDALQQGKVTLASLHERVALVGPVRGRTQLVSLVEELRERRSESIFDDEVRRTLRCRGYRPSNRPRRIATPDGRGVLADLLLPWQVAVDPEGDAFHRSRAQRRDDRRRIAQYAGTDVEVVPVDWADWVQQPERVLAAIDAAVHKQWERGLGCEYPLPPHLSGRV